MDIFYAHPFWTGVIAYWVYCAGVDSMPDPVKDSGGWYRFFYAFLHKIAGNLSVAFSSKIPGAKP